MKRFILSLLLIASIALPVVAQDTTPTADVATLESTPVETATAAPEPTAVPTEEPAPEPEPELPVDTEKIIGWGVAVLIVLIVGVVSIALVAIVQQAKSWPAPARELLLAVLNSGIGSLGDFANTTETPIDNLGVDELRKLYKQLEQELRATQSQVNAVQQTVAKG